MEDTLGDEHDALMAEVFAGHFPGSQVEGAVVDVGFGGLKVHCQVAGTQPMGAYWSASLFFNLESPALGPGPIFASMSGYGGDLREAIVTGCCNWACSFGPLLAMGLTGRLPEGSEEPDQAEVDLDGQVYWRFVEGLDRGFAWKPGAPMGERTAAARERLGAEPWLVDRVLGSGALPLLPVDRPSLVSVFVCEAAEDRTVEVKVNGANWPGMEVAFSMPPAEPEGGMSLLRELAVLVPGGAAPTLARDPVERTLVGLRTESGEPRPALAWPGWHAHGGSLGRVLTEEELAPLEQEVGPLPQPYRDFLTRVAGTGAGPGYGLISPLLPAQRRLAAGEFTWRDGEEVEAEPAGVLALAHAGCGILWLLVLRGPARGQVWVDAVGSDGLGRKVAEDFGVWYRDWLAAAHAGPHPWIQWDGMCCATPKVISQVLDSLEEQGQDLSAGPPDIGSMMKPGSLSIASGGSAYFAEGAALDPCESCASLGAQYGIGARTFAPGTGPLGSS